MSEPAASERAMTKPLIGWRILSLVYDFIAVLALWFVVASVFVLLKGDAVRGGMLGLFEFLVMYVVTGLYAAASWHRGGQTIGMKPWHLYVDAAGGGRAGWKGVWLRYVVGSISLLLAGAGFWWAYFDRDRLTWHDRVSGTRLLREPARDGAQG